MNTTTKEQGWRLVKAGCPHVKLNYTEGHHITPEPLELGRLWDLVRAISLGDPDGLVLELSTELSSIEVIEALVGALERHYTELHNGKE